MIGMELVVENWTRGHRMALGLLLFALAIATLVLSPTPWTFIVATAMAILGLVLFFDALVE